MIRRPGFLRGRGRAFLADAGGLAAIELALILPFAAMLMSLVVFGGQAYSVQRRVTLAATTVANIFAQANNTNSSTITAAELSQILAYPNLILYPYSPTGVAVEVSQLLVTVNGERHGDRHGLGQLGQRQWNRPPDRPAIVDRPLDRRRLFRDGQQLCRSRRGAVPVPADRTLFLRQHDDAARFDHHDPARRKPDHRAELTAGEAPCAWSHRFRLCAREHRALRPGVEALAESGYKRRNIGSEHTNYAEARSGYFFSASSGNRSIKPPISPEVRNSTASSLRNSAPILARPSSQECTGMASTPAAYTRSIISLRLACSWVPAP